MRCQPLLVAACAGLAASLNAAPRPVALAEVLDRVGRSVVAFEQVFASVIADERYVQRLSEPRRFLSSGSTFVDVTERTMTSELLLVWLPADHAWVGVRHVRQVDGVAVEDPLSFEDLMAAAPDGKRLRAVADHGARFNLGRIHRNFNDPIFGLIIFEPLVQRRFRFREAGRHREGDRTIVEIRFTEHDRPTIVLNGQRDVPMRGRVWVDEGTGAVVKSEVRLQEDQHDAMAELTVEYRHDARLGVQAPATMKESYVYKNGLRDQRIECAATYTNFRRFETSSRILPPGP